MRFAYLQRPGSAQTRMYAPAEPVSLRRHPSLRARLARVLAASKAVLQWSGLLAPFDRHPDEGDVALPERVRVATLVFFAGALVVAPIEILYASTEPISNLLLIGGLHLLFTSGIFLASYTTTGVVQADFLAVLLILEQVLMLEIGLSVWPVYPGLTTGVLNCVLVGSAVLFSWRLPRVCWLALVVSLSFAVVGASTIEGRTPYVIALGTVMVGAAISIGVAWRLAWLRDTLARRRDDLQALTQRLMSVQEEERRRLARELHDEFGQTLTAAVAYLWLIDRRLPEDMDNLRKPVAETRRLMTQTLGAMREMSHLLRPATLDDFGLVLSLDAHVKSFAERYDVVATFHADELPERLPADAETSLYRIAQEALSNVARHARASRVDVSMAVEDGQLRLVVDDDGVGFTADGRHDGIGLIGMRERVRMLHGRMTTSAPPGFRLDVIVPLRRTARTARQSTSREMQT
jgi:signal transduction histidine kinase